MSSIISIVFILLKITGGKWLGLNIGFWVSMAAVLLIVFIMNIVFWRMKSKQNKQYDVSNYQTSE